MISLSRCEGCHKGIKEEYWLCDSCSLKIKLPKEASQEEISVAIRKLREELGEVEESQEYTTYELLFNIMESLDQLVQAEDEN